MVFFGERFDLIIATLHKNYFLILVERESVNLMARITKCVRRVVRLFCCATTNCVSLALKRN